MNFETFDLGRHVYYIGRSGKPIECESCGKPAKESVLEIRSGIVRHINIHQGILDFTGDHEPYIDITYSIVNTALETEEYIDSIDVFLNKESCELAIGLEKDGKN